mgnify:FL=1
MQSPKHQSLELDSLEEKNIPYFQHSKISSCFSKFSEFSAIDV